MNGKQLKNSILQWAIQGKLVPQDPNDEPASILLERIREEKACLVKEGKIKKDKNESIIFRGDDNSHYEKFLATGEVKCIDDEIPFEIPEGWEWCRLKDMCSICTGATFKKDDATQSQRGTRILRGGNVLPFQVKLKDDDIFIPSNLVKENILLKQNDIVTPAVTSLENIGKMARIEADMLNTTVGGFVFILRPYYNNDTLSQYMLFVMSAPPTVEYMRSITNKSGQAFYNIGKERLATTLIPLPPYAEQRRIALTMSKTLPQVVKYAKHQTDLDRLNTTITSSLKKSILQEAIQGKLVPQDPNDEPASVLLGRIHEEKQRLLKDGKLKKKDITDSVIFKGEDNKYFEKVENDVIYLEEEIPFEIPETWTWVRLNDICEYIQRGKSPKYSEVKKYPVVAQKCNQWSGFSLEKALFIDPNTLPSYGQERFLQHGDLLWNSTGLGTLGRMAIYNESVNPYGVAVADSHVTVIRPIKSFINFEYLYLYFSSNEVQSVIEDKADGSTKQKELATKTIKSYLVPLPPLSEQHRIVAKYHSVASILSR